MMKRRILFVGLGGVALVAGFLSGRGGVAVLEKSSGAMDVGVVEERVRIHPELLAVLKGGDGKPEEGVEIRPPEGLGAEDFPGAFDDAIREGQDQLMRELIQHWAEIDLEGMRRYFLSRGSLQISQGAYSIMEIENLVLPEFVKRDPLMAWDFAKRFPENDGLRPNVLRLIGKRNPDLAVQLVMADLGALLNRNVTYGGRGGIMLGAEVNRRVVIALTQGESLGDDERSFLRELSIGDGEELAGIWGSLSAEQKARAATSLIPQIDDGGVLAGEIYRIARGRVGSGELEMSNHTRRFFETYGGRMLKDSTLADVWEWTRTNVGERYHTQAFGPLIKIAVESGVPVKEVLEQIDLEQQGMNRLASSLILTLHQTDPDVALERVAGWGEKAGSSYAAARLASSYATASAGEVVAAATKLGGVGEAFVAAVGGSKFDTRGGEGGLTWADELPDGLADVAARGVVQKWSFQDPAGAWKYVTELPEDAPGRGNFVDGIARAMLQKGEEERGAWVAALDSRELEQVRRVVLRSGNNREWREGRLAELDGGR